MQYFIYTLSITTIRCFHSIFTTIDYYKPHFIRILQTPIERKSLTTQTAAIQGTILKKLCSICQTTMPLCGYCSAAGLRAAHCRFNKAKARLSAAYKTRPPLGGPCFPGGLAQKFIRWSRDRKPGPPRLMSDFVRWSWDAVNYALCRRTTLVLIVIQFRSLINKNVAEDGSRGMESIAERQILVWYLNLD